MAMAFGTSGRPRQVASLVLLLVSIVLAGCTSAASDGPIAIKTEREGPVCQAARIGGILVPDPTYGLGFQGGGYEYGAVWPDGYTARREGGKVVLLNAAGELVAREGDRVVAGGAVDSQGAGHACFDIHVEPSPS